MEKLRVGLIGCGNMMAAHVRAFQEVEGVEVTAFCDLYIEKAEKYKNDLAPNAYVTRDYHTMLDYVDAVLVATLHESHYDIGMFFAYNGKHILMEKPLCNTEEECITLIKMCEEKGVTLMCAYPLPYRPIIQEYVDLIHSGEYGNVMQVSMWTEQLTGVNHIYPGSNGNLGGGQFFSHGCHYVDMMLRILGDPVEGSHFGTNVGTPWMLREGTSTAIFKFKNGTLGYHGATWGARGTHLGWRMQALTDKGMLELTRKDGKNTIKFYSGEKIHVPDTAETRSFKIIKQVENTGKETQYEINHFIDCVRTGNRPMTDGYSCLQSLRIIWRMYDSENHGTVADLTGLGLDDYYNEVKGK